MFGLSGEISVRREGGGRLIEEINRSLCDLKGDEHRGVTMLDNRAIRRAQRVIAHSTLRLVCDLINEREPL